MKLILTLVLLLVFPAGLLATAEGVLRLSDFTVQSTGIGESGPVTVSGKSSSQGVEAMTVSAFGKTITLTPDQLRGFMTNGIQLTYTHGHKELGGRTVYVQFSKGFPSGIVTTKTISFRENGTLTIQ